MPAPRSMNCRTPCATAWRTTRRSRARLARAMAPISGTNSMIRVATDRSTAKLCVPPRNASYTRAELGRLGSIGRVLIPGRCPNPSATYPEFAKWYRLTGEGTGVESRNELTGLLIDNAPDAVIVSRSDGVISMANRRAHDMFGYPGGVLVGTSIDALVPDEVRPGHPGQRSGYLCGDHPPLRRLPLRGRRRDGTVFPVEVSLSAITLDGPEAGGSGGETYVTAVLRDDTTQRQAAATRALLASIVQSSHDAIV